MQLRSRDVRAILFCVLSATLLAGALLAWLPHPAIDLGLVAAYILYLLSRPRMRRVMARLQDKPSWRGYFRN